MKLTRTLPPAFAALLFVAACGSDDTTDDTASAEVAESSSTTAPSDATTSTTVAESSSTTASLDTTDGEATAKVNINTASIDDLTSAFEAVGVTNAGRWAFEVDEYRPYSEDDTDFAKLRQELGKYNIDPAELELIISVLTY